MKKFFLVLISLLFTWLFATTTVCAQNKKEHAGVTFARGDEGDKGYRASQEARGRNENGTEKSGNANNNTSGNSNSGSKGSSNSGSNGNSNNGSTGNSNSGSAGNTNNEPKK